MGKGTDTFVRITNKDIYKAVTDLSDHVKVTNGKVSINRWIASTALVLIGVVIPVVIALK